MTNLIIHQDTNIRREYLLESLNELLDRDYTLISQILTNPDIHIIENTANLSISIDDVKRMQKELVYQPFAEKYQVGIIFYGENLTVEAQNALLKTLEDDRKSTVFYILVNNEKNLLDTIISRGIKHYVKTEPNNLDHKKEEILTPEIIDLELTEKFTFIEALIEKDKEDKYSVSDFLNNLLKYYREELHLAVKAENEAKIRSCTDDLNEIGLTSQRIAMNVNKRIALENMIIAITSD
jgi:hypothetical protein